MPPLLQAPKPHKTYAELVSLLKKRKMIIADEERAKRKLAQIGYYRLSGFWYPCRQGKIDENGNYATNAATGLPIRENIFQEGTDFDLIIDLYLFDKKLRQLMLDAIERVEIHIRSVIAHEIGRFDSLAYQNQSFINPKVLEDKKDKSGLIGNYWKDWTNRQEKLIANSKEDSILWHKRNNRFIPFWVVVETWDFGLMSKYFENLKGRYQEIICNRLDVPNKKVLRGWLQEINELRNHCAHHSRIWNRVSGNAIKTLDNSYFKNLNLDMDARKRIFGKACVLWFLVRKIGPNSNWINKLADLIDTKPILHSCPYTSMGLSDNNGFPRDLFRA